MTSLIEELYTSSECKTIKEFFNEDILLRKAIVDAIGSKAITDRDKILLSNPIDVIYMVCLTAKFANSEEECHKIAITVFQYLNKPLKVLPYLSDEQDLTFSNKTLIALSFYPKALEHRYEYHGAPSPAFYRKISKAIFKRNGQHCIADHHEQWEGFLGEMFV